MIFIHRHSSPCREYGYGQADNGLVLHQPDLNTPPALIPRQFSIIWWTGAGIYYRQADNLWIKGTSQIAGKWQDTAYFTSMAAAGTQVVGVVDANDLIRRAVRSLGLTPASSFLEVTLEQCEALQALAEQWHLMYCWSERQQKRHYRKPLAHYVFNWSFEG